MKTIETIEKEYEEFDNLYEVRSLEDLDAIIEQQILTISEDVVLIKKEYKSNRKDKFFANIRNKIPIIFEEEEIEFYDEELEYIVKLSCIAEMHVNQLESILLCSDEQNFKELTKLLSFMVYYYQKNSDYIDSQIDSLEYAYKGYSYVNNSEEDNFVVIDEFFRKKINEYSPTKPVEKNIYLCYHK